jgi:hypothetical protein
MSRAWILVRRRLAIPAVAAAVVALVAQLPYYGDFPGFDMNLLAIVARGWLDGLVPYKDLFFERGPIDYIFLGGIEAIAPQSQFALRSAFVILVVVSAVLLAALVQRHSNRRLAWATAVVYALAASSPLWELHEANTEQIGLPFIVAAVDLADRYSLSGRWWQALGAGAAVAGAFWAKPPVAFAGVLVLALLLLRREGRVRAILFALAGSVVASAVIVAPTVVQGATSDMRWTLTQYLHRYISAGFHDLAHRSLVEQIAWIFNAPGTGFFVLALGLGAISWILGRHRRLVAIGSAWLLLEYAGAKFGVRDFPHYFAPLIPGSAVLICIGADAVAGHLTGLNDRVKEGLALVALLSLATYLVIDTGVQRLASGSPEDDALNEQIASVVNKVTPEGDPIFVAANVNGYQTYWYADRNPSIRFFFPEVMGGSPYVYDRQYVEDARTALSRHPPPTIVIWPDSLAATGDDYVEPAIRRGGLRQVADIAGVRIFSRRLPPGS